MIRNAALILMLMVVVGACGPRQKSAEGLPPRRKAQELLDQLPVSDFQRLRLSGKGVLEQGETKQRFRFDLRMLEDSLIWLDLSDPLLGIKVARGLLSRDSAQYYNRLQGRYFQGAPKELEEQWGFNLEFGLLFPLLSRRPIPLEPSPYLEREVGLYRLRDYDPSGKKLPDPRRESFRSIELNRQGKLIEQQEIRQPTNGKALRVRYGAPREDYPAIPSKITLIYAQEQRTQLSLEINSVDLDESFNLPFRIPQGYERIR